MDRRLRFMMGKAPGGPLSRRNYRARWHAIRMHPHFSAESDCLFSASGCMSRCSTPKITAIRTIAPISKYSELHGTAILAMSAVITSSTERMITPPDASLSLASDSCSNVRAQSRRGRAAGSTSAGAPCWAPPHFSSICCLSISIPSAKHFMCSSYFSRLNCSSVPITLVSAPLAIR